MSCLLSMYIPIYMYMYVHIYLHVHYVHIYLHAHIYHIYIYGIYTYMYTMYTYTYMYIYTYMYMYTYMYIVSWCIKLLFLCSWTSYRKQCEANINVSTRLCWPLYTVHCTLQKENCSFNKDLCHVSCTCTTVSMLPSHVVHNHNISLSCGP